MPLLTPRLDDRSYDQILRETLARIPVHTPEWTNFTPSDPGVTLIELFAFMTDNMLYRCNLVPERNRLKFLQLLALPLRPASAAQGVITIANERGPMETVTLPSGLGVLAGSVPFLTTDGLDVLPIEARVYYRRRLTGIEERDARQMWELFQLQADDPSELEFYETVPFDPPAAEADLPVLDLGGSQTVDRSAWIAVLAREGDTDLVRLMAQLSRKTLTLGIMPAPDPSARRLNPGGPGAARVTVPLQYSLFTGRPDQPYLPLAARTGSDPTLDLTLVELTLPAWNPLDVRREPNPLNAGTGDLPPLLQDDRLLGRLLTWIRIQVVPNQQSEVLASGARARFSWIGVNASRISQRVEVVGEPIGTGTGEPDQRFRLANAPVLPGTVRLMVNGEAWEEIDDLLAAAPEVPVRDPLSADGAADSSRGHPRRFAVDPEAGEVFCGDGLRGTRFPANAPLIASYAYSSGPAGNLGVRAINTAPTLPAGFVVSNPLPTWGGSPSETVAEAERSIPLRLKNRNQAVSKEDFREIVRRTPGIELARVEIVPLLHPEIGAPSPGVVTVLVIPRDLRRLEGPEPDGFFLRAVCEHLEPRRVITTEVHVRGPVYVPVMVSVGVDVAAGAEAALVRKAIEDRLKAFLAPAPEPGWPLGKAVDRQALLVEAARVPDVVAVRTVLLWSGKTTGAVEQVPITGLELPRLDRITVSVGEAEDLLAAAPVTGRRVPVPLIPKAC
jgi:predicted phage baseplate assembly protein